MRVNCYAEELTSRVTVIRKTTEAGSFIGLRFFLELPISVPAGGGHSTSHRGPFIRRSGDDDSSAVTFWADDAAGLRKLLAAATTQLNRSDPIGGIQGGTNFDNSKQQQVQPLGQYERIERGQATAQGHTALNDLCYHGYDKGQCPVSNSCNQLKR